jgi:hypothetical protein
MMLFSHINKAVPIHNFKMSLASSASRHFLRRVGNNSLLLLNEFKLPTVSTEIYESGPHGKCGSRFFSKKQKRYSRCFVMQHLAMQTNGPPLPSARNETSPASDDGANHGAIYAPLS